MRRLGVRVQTAATLVELALPRPYRAWGYPVTPILFVGLSAWMAALAIRDKPAAAWAGIGTLLVSVGLYAVVARRRRNEATREAA